MTAATTCNTKKPERGIIGLLAGGAVLIAAVWAFAIFLGGSLAQVHMRHKAQGVSVQTAMVLHEAGETLAGPLKPATQTELRRLMKYREVARMDIADASGRVVWSSAHDASAGRIAVPETSMRMTTYKTGNAELERAYTHTAARMTSPAGLVALDIDVTGMIAWYRRISFIAAKAITTVLLGGFFVMGMILFGKYHERQKAETRLDALRRENAIEQEKVRALQAQLDELNAAMASFNRKLGSAMKDNGKGADTPAAAKKSRKTG